VAACVKIARTLWTNGPRRSGMPDPTRQCELSGEISLCGELSCDSKLKITKDLVTQTQDHTAPLNSRLKITQQLLTQPNSSESRDALARHRMRHRWLCCPATHSAASPDHRPRHRPPPMPVPVPVQVPVRLRAAFARAPPSRTRTVFRGDSELGLRPALGAVLSKHP